MALKRESDPANKPLEQFLNEPTPVANEPELDLLSGTMHRAAAVTPRISDLLARVEGIQRWGLNE